MPEKLAAVPKQSFPETWKPKIGASVIVNTGGVAQQWRVSHIKIATGTLVTIKFENSEMIADKSWYVFDKSLGSLVLQRLGFFEDMALKRTTNSFEVWRNILNPEKMMDGETLMVLLEWTIYGCSGKDKLGLLASQSKTWLVDRSFWQSWVQKNEPQRIPPGECSKWVCMEEEPVWGMEVVHDRLRAEVDTRFSEQTGAATGHYIKGIAGHYMPLESFSNFRKGERMIAKIKFPVPIHLLDHLIIPINVRESHWFLVHMNLQTRCISLLDSSHAYSAAAYPKQKMLLWKNFNGMDGPC